MEDDPFEVKLRDNYADRIGNRNIYFAVEDKCFQLSVNEGKVVCKEITELKSNREEADTKLLLHESMHLKTVRPP